MQEAYNTMIYITYIILGLIPSTVWLLFYLREDVHPEPNKTILKIFAYGMIIALVAAAIEIILEKIFKIISGDFFIPSYISFIFYYFIGTAFVEEFLKYFVVKKKVVNSQEFDEPTDAMIYMIISALGFAAMENILVLFPLWNSFTFSQTIILFFLRFVGATLLHALCSGTVGFFLALSIFEPKKKWQFLLVGFLISTTLHGFYNFSIMNLSANFDFIFALIFILIALISFVSFGFKKLRKIKSICEIE